jgi:putative SOS response-associated peptidase YedK
MCGRYAIYTAPHKLAEMFGLENLLNLPPRYNAAPLQEMPIIIHNRMGVARWGLLPPWATADDRMLCAKMINARSETVSEKPAFRESWQKRRRCLIPADGFYEWVTDETAQARQPFFIHNADKTPLAMAGLWIKTADIVTFTILTKEADGPAAALHHRLPVLIDPTRAAEWFAADEAGARTIIAQSNGAQLAFHPVSKAVGTVANDSEDLIKAYQPAA